MSFNAEMKVVRFGSEDVIATSGIPNSFTLTKFGKGNTSSDGIGDGVISFNNQTYNNDASGASAFIGELSSFYNGPQIARDNNNTYTVQQILDHERNSTFSSSWNGTYKWDGTRFFRQ